MKRFPPNLRPFELRLLNAIDILAVEIAGIAKALPSAAAAEHYIEQELSKFAVQMRQHEVLGTTPAASLGFAVDACLRERISIALVE